MRQQQNTKGPVNFEIRGFRFTVEESPDLFIEGVEYALNIVRELISDADRKGNYDEQRYYVIAATTINLKLDELKRSRN